MPILPVVGRNTYSIRVMVTCIYAVLTLLGLTMALPFLITLTCSVSNDFDYYRYNLLPRYFYSSTDRFTKGLVLHFNETVAWPAQMRSYFPSMPTTWAGWKIAEIGRAHV